MPVAVAALAAAAAVTVVAVAVKALTGGTAGWYRVVERHPMDRRGDYRCGGHGAGGIAGPGVV